MKDPVVVTPALAAAAEKLGVALPPAARRAPAAAAAAFHEAVSRMDGAPPAAAAQAAAEAVASAFSWPQLPWTTLYNRLQVGRFENPPLLAWTAPDQFRFLQPEEPARQFRYVRHDGTVIRPGAMDTDGGSIFGLATLLPGFSKWGYAPAFLVHDWLFVAHKCGHAPDNGWTFEDTALIMAECLKTLITVGWQSVPGPQANGQPALIDGGARTVYTMYQAVASPIARALFNDPATVTCYAPGSVGYRVAFTPR